MSNRKNVYFLEDAKKNTSVKKITKINKSWFLLDDNIVREIVHIGHEIKTVNETMENFKIITLAADSREYEFDSPDVQLSQMTKEKLLKVGVATSEVILDKYMERSVLDLHENNELEDQIFQINGL
ncbi:hypothetical protein [Priestia koreensis]|uniref:Uncharacterized protein n=1 Tax=Priestia koreensis TaxID=284581 RepID=A0A0M0KNF9_9BACI|nr:hypothetical protein [Priestia koreensis]KOO40340.1 hypothetical protein AMD01_21565 [Priestia koreensis]